ncbi:ImmA/IrrE family metallo-endopeptidase [Galactobacillus timonensis]|uniref:ImmA/IrrE family metallo-endopeptidase n=1 Tax=Galactobacillus timonensis TaxID=2041840 RepID=UPI0010845870|nr:hypothetical protein [Galactobacillus timonensis]
MYKDFKSYIQVNYGDLLQEKIQKYIDERHDGQGFHAYGVVSLLDQKIENMQVMSLSCHEVLGPKVEIDVHVKADIVMQSLGTSKVEAGRKTRWFTVYMEAVLQNGLHHEEVINVDEYYNGKFDIENALDAYMLPYIKSEQLEDIADDFTRFCCDKEQYNGWNSPLKQILKEMGLKCYVADLPQGEMGRMYFRKQVESVEEFITSPGERLPKRTTVQRVIDPGTMLISRDHFFIRGYGSQADTISHEIVHWDKHDKFFEIISLLNQDEKSLHCESSPVDSPENLEGLAKARWWAEWQANALAPRYLMPRWIFTDYFPKMLQENREMLEGSGASEGQIMEEALSQIAGVFKVTKYEAKLRALQLGYKQAEGAFIRVKGYKREPFTFQTDALGDYQTFILDNRNGTRLYNSDPKFRELIDSKRFIYTGCLVCIKDPLYVQRTDDPSCPEGFELTEYARNHVDECCLKFTRHYTQENAYTEYYNECFLSRDINSADFSETRDIEYECNQSVKDQEKNLRELDESYESVLEQLDTLPGSFYGTFNAHMKRVKKENGKKMTNEELSFRTGISKDYIGKLRHQNVNIQFETVCALCQGMHLHPVFSDDMIAKAVGKYPQTKEGLNAQVILHYHFRESLKVVNARLRKQGYPEWGCDEKIIDNFEEKSN